MFWNETNISNPALDRVLQVGTWSLIDDGKYKTFNCHCICLMQRCFTGGELKTEDTGERRESRCRKMTIQMLKYENLDVERYNNLDVEL